MAACRLGVISINSSGAAEVDRNRCMGCGLCVKACPKGLIRLTYGLCVKTGPMDTIRIENVHAVIDEEQCITCGICAVDCPRGTIGNANGIFYN